MTDMRGKVVLITGATNGIGRVTALELAKLGAATVIVSRSPQRVERTVDEIRQVSGNSQVEGLVADLALMAQVRQVADEFRRKYNRLDVLVNNAGAGASQRVLTTEGIERMFALNHLSYFLLTHLLLDMLKASAPARIVNVSSDAHRPVQLDFDDLQSTHDWGPSGFRAYGRTKLMNILFTRELARHLEGTGVTANALHPGTVATGLWKNTGSTFGALLGVLAPLFMKTPEQGAETSIYLAVSPEVTGVSGLYFSECKATAPSKAAQDDAAARRLWEISLEMTGLAVRA